jgi:hypothetical protein
LLILKFRLRAIRKKSGDEEKRAQRENSWIKIIEEKAMKVSSLIVTDFFVAGYAFFVATVV